MFGLFISLALLGLSAIDPIGIAAMPILLVQEQPYKRSFVFLGGSWVSLMVMGLLFARGFGTVVLRFEKSHGWFVPGAEALAGVVLLVIAATLLYQTKVGKLSPEPSDAMQQRLQLGNWQLFGLGAGLVAVQSVVDVVFVIAMIRVGQLHEAGLTLIAAVATYAITALVLQIAVVVTYWRAPTRHKQQTLTVVQRLLTNYANEALIGISFVLGCALLLVASRS